MLCTLGRVWHSGSCSVNWPISLDIWRTAAYKAKVQDTTKPKPDRREYAKQWRARNSEYSKEYSKKYNKQWRVANKQRAASLAPGAYYDGSPKRCGGCREVRPRDPWFFCEDLCQNDHLNTFCRVCNRIRSYKDSERKQGRKNTQTLRVLYEIVDRYFKAQNGRCAIRSCRKPITFWADTVATACLEHDHRTGHIRGLTCKPCNDTLGNHPAGYFLDLAEYVAQATLDATKAPTNGSQSSTQTGAQSVVFTES